MILLRLGSWGFFQADLFNREQLNGVPEKLEARISEKRFLTAVEVLSDALRVIKQPEMMEIGALSDLRTYLGSQESVYDSTS